MKKKESSLAAHEGLPFSNVNLNSHFFLLVKNIIHYKLRNQFYHQQRLCREFRRYLKRLQNINQSHKWNLSKNWSLYLPQFDKEMPPKMTFTPVNLLRWQFPKFMISSTMWETCALRRSRKVRSQVLQCWKVIRSGYREKHLWNLIRSSNLFQKVLVVCFVPHNILVFLHLVLLWNPAQRILP